MTTSIDELRRNVLGPVLEPGSAELATEIAGFNTVAVPEPAVVVGATCEEDVQAAVRFASDHGLGVGILSTGHGHFAVAERGLVITTARMARVSVDVENRTATLRAGVQWRQVLDLVAQHGLAPLSGSSSSVGAVGYMLGGGVGPLARKYGFAADYVKRLRLVSADGQVREVDQDQDPELFWAVRGAKANLGVVTEVEIELVPVRSVFAASVLFDSGSIETVLRTYAAWITDLPDEFTTSIAICRVPDAPAHPAAIRGRTVAHLRFISCQPEPFEEADRAARTKLEDMLNAGHVLHQEIGRYSYDRLDHVHADPVEPTAMWQRSGQLATLSAEVIDAILAVADPVADGGLAMVEVRHLGGALQRPQRTPNAVAGRAAEFNLLLVGLCELSRYPQMTSRGEEAYGRLRPYLVGRNLANWLGCATDPTDVRQAWEPDTLNRLLAVKARVDPNNLFRFGHPIVDHDAN